MIRGTGTGLSPTSSQANYRSGEERGPTVESRPPNLVHVFTAVFSRMRTLPPVLNRRCRLAVSALESTMHPRSHPERRCMQIVDATTG